MSEILDNIYIWVFLVNSESVLLLALVKYMLCSHFTQNCIFCTFWRLKILVLWQKIVQNLLIFVYLFCPKNSTTDFTKTFITQEWLVVESCPTHCWIAFLMLYRLVFNIHSHFNEPILAWSFWFYRNYIFFKNFVIERSEFLKKSSYAESVCLKMIMPFHFISGRAF